MTSATRSTSSRPPVTAADFGRVSRPSFARLTAIEVRKAVDYRAGRWILAAILLLALAGLGWRVWHAGQTPILLGHFVGSSMGGAGILLPVLGVMAMTSEWSQRTALTTFTLTPRRVRVLCAKLVAALLLMVVVMAAVYALSALAVLLAGLVSGDPVGWDLSAKDAAGQLASQSCFVLMGAGIGAVIPVTGVALTIFFLLPMLLAIASETVLKKVGEWFDVFGAFGRVQSFDLDGKAGQTATSLLVFVVLPTVVGLWLSSRREVK